MDNKWAKLLEKQKKVADKAGYGDRPKEKFTSGFLNREPEKESVWKRLKKKLG